MPDQPIPFVTIPSRRRRQDGSTENLPPRTKSLKDETVDGLCKFAKGSENNAREVHEFIKTPEGAAKLRQGITLAMRECFREQMAARNLGRMTGAVMTQHTTAEGYTILNEIMLTVLSNIADGDFYSEFLEGFFKEASDRLNVGVKVLLKVTNMDQLMKTVLSSAPGVFADREAELRRLFYDNYPVQASALYASLAVTLGILNIPDQAKLLYIFYGPRDEDGYLDWQAYLTANRCSLENIHSFAAAFTGLTCKYGLSRGEAIRLLEQLFKTPQEWHVTVSGQFLLRCMRIKTDYIAVQLDKNPNDSYLQELLDYVREKEGRTLMKARDRQKILEQLLPGFGRRGLYEKCL